MTDRNRAVLRFIKDFQRAYPGLSPTYRNLMDAVDIPSTSIVAYYLNQLMVEGELEDLGRYNRHGMVVMDTVLLTKTDALELGLDWGQLTARRDRIRQRLEKMTYGDTGNGPEDRQSEASLWRAP